MNGGGRPVPFRDGEERREGRSCGEAVHGIGATTSELTGEGGATPPFAATFLRHPQRLPTVRGSRAWGRRRLLVDFAGGPYAFSGLADAQYRAVRARFGGYCRSSARPAAVLTRVRRVDAAAFRRFDLAGWEYTLEFEARPRRLRFVGLTFVGAVAVAPRLAGTLWSAVPGHEEFLEGFENYFRVLAAYRLAQLGGALLHSAAVIVGGRAYVFFGPSGAGKTTLAANARRAGFRVLSDDMNAIAPSPAGTVVERLPFAGELTDRGTPARALSLGGLYRLAKAARPALRSLDRATVVAEATACAPYLNADPYRAATLLDALAALLQRVPGGILEVGRDTPFADVAALLEQTPC